MHIKWLMFKKKIEIAKATVGVDAYIDPPLRRHTKTVKNYQKYIDNITIK